MKRKIDMKNSLTIILVLLLLGILGFSYAYFQPILSSTGNNNLIVSKDLRLLFNDESISEGEIYPGESYSKKFTVTNNGSSTLYYEIKWDNYNNTFTNDEIHIELKCVSYINYTNESKSVSGTCEGISDKAVTADSLKEGIEITSGKTHEYEVILTFIETGTNQDYNKGKVFNSTLGVVENVLLTVNLNSGVSGQTFKTAYEIGETLELYQPTKSGHVFSGWNVSGRRTSLNGDTLTIGDANASLTANFIAFADMYTYTGSSTIIDDTNGNWRIKFTNSGTYTFTPLLDMKIDAFLVGGGAGGSQGDPAIGGGGGYTASYSAINLTKNTPYSITVGSGGAATLNGNSTTAFGYSANGGLSNGNGGSGGGRGGYGYIPGNGGSNGLNGKPNSYNQAGGTGQVTTTREFGELTGDLYSGGGGGSCLGLPSGNTGGLGGTGGGGTGAWSNSGRQATAGTANTGGGGGAGLSNYTAGSGGSGIVVIRNTRKAVVGNEKKYSFSYMGSYSIEDGTTDNWKIKFLTSGTFIPLDDMLVDTFLVGGGGGGLQVDVSTGAGGGYTNMQTLLPLVKNTSYSIIVGDGGVATLNGASSSAFGYTAVGGYAAGNGGSGGGKGGYGYIPGNGGSNGSDGYPNTYNQLGGLGQAFTTREFYEATGTLYSGGGGGSCTGLTSGNTGGLGGSGGGGTGAWANSGRQATAGTANTGGGGGAGLTSGYAGGAGGSGIVIIRNTKVQEVGGTEKFKFSYNGVYTTTDSTTNSWRIKFLTSGTFTPFTDIVIDAFLVGGGGGGAQSDPAIGAGGGYTVTNSSITLTKNISYTITIGSGGEATLNGSASSAFGYSANGGLSNGNGGSGGGRGGYGYIPGNGGSNGSNGYPNSYSQAGGTGQGTTTKEFGETIGTLYSGGGGGSSIGLPSGNTGGLAGDGGGGIGAWANSGRKAGNGTPNTGGGGGAGLSSTYAGGKGGSGIVVIRKH